MSIQLPLIIFAKAPIAGQVKTRLQSHCSAAQAAEIAEILLSQTLHKATQAWPGRVILSVSLDSDHPLFRQMQQRYGVDVAVQCEGDLGAKMLGAFEEFGYPAAIIGADAPHVQSTALQQAHHALLDGRDVLGPSLDGGYYLLGLSQVQATLFSDMPWGGCDVLGITQQRAQREFTQLEPLNDVDHWPDVLQTAQQLPELAAYLDAQGLV